MAFPLRRTLPLPLRDDISACQPGASASLSESSARARVGDSKLRVVYPESSTGTPNPIPNPIPSGAESMSGSQPQRGGSDSASLPQVHEQPEGAAAAVPPLLPTDELLDELRAASQLLEAASPQDILRWTVERYAPLFTMATAFGPEGMCLIHMLSEIAPQTPLFNLETGYQFAETMRLREQVKSRYGIEVEYKYPDTTVEQYEALHGGPLYKTNPNQCCADRKLTVLRRAARGFHAWGSAIRRDQSPDRAQAAIVGWDKKFQLIKVSPLANWTKKDVWGFINKHDIPYNPLHDQGYPSIGCWPCTRRVMEGEDERAGRWSGFTKTECGLHSS